MRPSSIIKILIKSILLPLMAMCILNKLNLCEFITFIPTDYRFEAGLALYMAIMEAITEFIEYLIAKTNATIICTFYTNERREDRHVTPFIEMNDNSMGIANIWCHIILDGNYKKLSGTEICLDIPLWFVAQLDADSGLKQDDHQIKWNVSTLLPKHNNQKNVHTEMRMKISFIRNNVNDIFITLEPTIKNKFGLKFETNGVTIQNAG